MKSNLKIWFPYILTTVTGFFFGSINNYSDLELDTKINLGDLLTVVATLAVGIFIPLTLKKFLDDTNNIKKLIIDQTQTLVDDTSEAHKVICDCYSNGSIEATDKDKIISYFSNAEMQLDTIREQLEVSFPSKSTASNLTNALLKYKNFLTGGELMNSHFTTVSEDFYQRNKMEFSAFKRDVMVEIHRIYKF